MSLRVERKQLVAPGELLAGEGYLAGGNTYREDSGIYSSRVGLVEVAGNRLSVVPLKGCYIPKVGDLVIGMVSDIGMSGWVVDIKAPYLSLLPANESSVGRQPMHKVDLSKVFDAGDLVLAEVIAFDRSRNPLISARGQGLGKVSSGRIVEVSSAKIPRLIGRQGSMVNMLKKETGCQIIIGQNGVVLVSGSSRERENLALAAINMIAEEAHTRGLTDRVLGLIKQSIGGESDEPKGVGSKTD